MNDGKSLERGGVIPDVLMIPSSLHLKNKHDVVLSSVALRAGITIGPDKAATLFSKNERK
jgi:hypothetical protein